MKIKELYLKYKKQDKLFKLTTIISLTFNLLIGISKWILAIFNGVVFFLSGVINILMGAAKLLCYTGLLTNEDNYKKRNLIISILVFASGLEYFIYMFNVYIGNFTLTSYNSYIAILIALISFIEIGLAIYGLFKVKGKGHSYRNLKLINFVLGVEAMVLTENAILSFTSKETYVESSSLFGFIVGLFVMILSIFMLLSPYITIADQEKNDFVLLDESKNKIISKEGEVLLKHSYIYGDYVYKYRYIDEKEVEGEIIRKEGFFKKANIFIKIKLIILSEILIFVWLIGRFIYFLRCAFLIKELEKVMRENGFQKH